MRMTLRRFSSWRNDPAAMHPLWPPRGARQPTAYYGPLPAGSSLPCYPGGMDRAGARDGDSQQLELFQAAELLLEECRTVLPGIQGLFGFQLVAVFSSHFHDALSQGEKH